MHDERKRSTAGVWIALTLIALLVVYQLSLGPVYGLIAGGVISDPVLWAYWPLMSAPKFAPSIGLAYGDYISLWVPEKPRRVPTARAKNPVASEPQPAEPESE